MQTHVGLYEHPTYWADASNLPAFSNPARLGGPKKVAMIFGYALPQLWHTWVWAPFES